jgi:hypothetical protein
LPTHPGYLGPWRELEIAMPISVIPYLSSKTWPEISFHLSRVGTGRAAEPETMSRIRRQASLV